MKKLTLSSLCLLAVMGIGPVGSYADADADTKPAEHHLYLHLVQPDGDESVRLIVVDQPELPGAPAETSSEALAAESADEPATGDAPAMAEPAEPDSSAEDTEAAEAVTDTEPEPEQDAKVALDEVVAEDDTTLLPPISFPPEAAESIVIADTEPAGPDRPMGLMLFIFVLAIFLGFELISKVPSQLHTPLMSGSNAISGITIVGALAAAGLGVGGAFGTFLGTLAVTFATINVVGGYMVTNRMLGMFKKKDGGTQ